MTPVTFSTAHLLSVTWEMLSSVGFLRGLTRTWLSMVLAYEQQSGVGVGQCQQDCAPACTHTRPLICSWVRVHGQTDGWTLFSRGWFWGYEETRGLNVSCLSVQGSASIVAPVLLKNTSAR